MTATDAMHTVLTQAGAPVTLQGIVARLKGLHDLTSLAEAAETLVTERRAQVVRVNNRVVGLQAVVPNAMPAERATDREAQVLAVIGDGATSAQVAAKLGITRVRATTILCLLANKGLVRRAGRVPHPTRRPQRRPILFMRT